MGSLTTQSDHILIDRRWLSRILDVQSCRGANCDTDHSLVVASVMERLAVIKKAAQNSDRVRFNLRKLMELEEGNNIRLRFRSCLQLRRTSETVRT